MKLFISDKVSTMPTSIFSSMSKMAFEYNAINLGQGFPNFDGPDRLKEELYKATLDGKNQYAPSIGIYSLRKKIAEYHKEYYDLMKRYDISSVFSVLGKELKEAGFEFEHIFIFVLFVMLMDYTDFYELSFYNFVKLSRDDYWKFFEVDSGVLVRVKQTGGLN